MIEHATMNIDDVLKELGVTITCREVYPTSDNPITRKYSHWNVRISKGRWSMVIPATEPPTVERIVYRMISEAEVLDYPDANEWMRDTGRHNPTEYTGTRQDHSEYSRRLAIALNYNWVIGRRGMMMLEEAVHSILESAQN